MGIIFQARTGMFLFGESLYCLRIKSDTVKTDLIRSVILVPAWLLNVPVVESSVSCPTLPLAISSAPAAPFTLLYFLASSEILLLVITVAAASSGANSKQYSFGSSCALFAL